MWNFIWFILVVLFLVIIGALVVGIYTNLVKLRKKVEKDWSYLDVELERKTILAGNLVETVKRYAKKEKYTLEEITEARHMLMYAETVKEIAEANNRLTETIEDLLGVVENYPDLKASKRFEELRGQLEETEDMIAEYWYLYNEIVYIYNSKCQKFPNNKVANYFGFENAEFFDPEEKATDASDLDFDPSNEVEHVSHNK